MDYKKKMLKILKPEIDRHELLTVKCRICGGGVCRSGICHLCSVVDKILATMPSKTEIAKRVFVNEVMKKQSSTFMYVHLREWSKSYDRELGYKGSAIAEFLSDVADWLEEQS